MNFLSLNESKSIPAQQAVQKDESFMQTYITKDSYIIILDKNGAMFSSEEVAAKLSNLQYVAKNICFLIGPPEGFTEQFLNQAHEKWSLSKLTFPHTLARLLLVEVIYRSIAI